jgi:hypothetical protein
MKAFEYLDCSFMWINISVAEIPVAAHACVGMLKMRGKLNHAHASVGMPPISPNLCKIQYAIYETLHEDATHLGWVLTLPHGWG